MVLRLCFVCEPFAFFRKELVLLSRSGFHGEQTRRWNRSFRTHSRVALGTGARRADGPTKQGTGTLLARWQTWTLCADGHTHGADIGVPVMDSTMTRANELRAQARALYQCARTTRQADESLIHVLHAIELEAEAEQVEHGEIPEAHVIDYPNRDRHSA